MDLPQPPQGNLDAWEVTNILIKKITDTELRNIIDKLAQFVARNGPEFEQMTKNKQKGNPKFQFLYGGEYFNYYQYKVTTEQASKHPNLKTPNTNKTRTASSAVLKQQGVLCNTPANWNPPPVPSNPELDQIAQQQDTLRDQIKQSEQNLSAQHAVLLQQQQLQVEAAILKCEMEDLNGEAERCGVPLHELYAILQPIIDSCTKDGIGAGKSWILQHATNKEQALCIAHCLLLK